MLDFAAGAQPMDASLVAGMEFDGEVGFYPARAPLRALIKSRSGAAAAFGAELGGTMTVEGELGRYAQALALAPWMERWPVVLTAVIPVPGIAQWLIRDESGATLPLRPGFAGVWKLMALSGGRAMSMMGEWDGEFLSPLAVWGGGVAFEDLASRWAA